MNNCNFIIPRRDKSLAEIENARRPPFFSKRTFCLNLQSKNPCEILISDQTLLLIYSDNKK
jgi:hypothetical protein